MRKNTIYYKTYEDDFVKSKNQYYEVEKGYIWNHTNLFYCFAEWLSYRIAVAFDFFYCKFCLRIKVENQGVLKDYKNSGFFLYGNHTQPVGDAFIPTYVCRGKKVYVLVSPANLGIPFLGKILPLLGALPISKTRDGLEQLKKTVEIKARKRKCIVIYPEAHVWKYYTKIRPFSSNSFRFPIENNLPSFCITTTYQKAKKNKKPKITVYVDGPFWGKKDGTEREKRQALRDEVYECMVNRSKNSTYEYIHYEEEKNV